VFEWDVRSARESAADRRAADIAVRDARCNAFIAEVRRLTCGEAIKPPAAHTVPSEHEIRERASISEPGGVP